LPRNTGNFLEASDYFAEEVRREIADRYGDDGLYEGGLSVRTTLDPVLQSHARRAMRNGLEEFDRQRGWRGAVTTIDITQDWGAALGEVDGLSDIEEWSLAVVLAVGEDGAQLGLMPPRLASRALSDERPTGFMPASAMEWAGSNPSEIVTAGDVIYVRAEPTEAGDVSYSLRQVPEVSGGMVAMDPYTGRVLAMVGGFSFAESQFNAPHRRNASRARRSSRSSMRQRSIMATRPQAWSWMRRLRSIRALAWASGGQATIPTSSTVPKHFASGSSARGTS
jgi:penicillin-binding protein 1A